MSRIDPVTTAGQEAFEPDEQTARDLDRADPLAACRALFHVPPGRTGEPVIYFAGNSLGLQPKSVRGLLEEELEEWARRAVDGHFRGRRPWYAYHELFRETGARLVGARPGEVVMMNSLTVNLHLMMVSFFRPTADRYRVLIEAPAFPSDLYAVKTHLVTRGLDPADALIVVEPRPGEQTLRTEDVESRIADRGDSIALVLMAGVNFLTGQVLDMPRITAAGHDRGCVVGFDLAHAAGNIPLALHDWGVDFACWCSYKYLNSGPGAIAGCFVHERHAANADLPRYAGWWGNDPEKRFLMQLEPRFIPRPDAEGWQISNPPILAMTPLVASLEIFDRAGMTALREKSLRLTRYLRSLIDRSPRAWFEIITPRAEPGHGCQTSILVHDRPRERFEALQRSEVIGDFREPNVIRVAPVPLYNSYLDVWRFVRVLTEGTEARGRERTEGRG